MKVVTFKAEGNLLALLDQYAINHRISRSEAIRLAIEKMLRDELTKEPTTSVARVEKIHLY